MKLLVLSDSHGNISNLKKAVDKYKANTDVIIHCGDGTRGEAMWLKEQCTGCMTVCVKGNCDFGSCLNDIEYLDIANKKIMITHGHLYSVKYGLEKLAYKAKEQGIDIVFFGHTHIPADTIINGVRLINPGSCGMWRPTCAVVEIDDKGNTLVNILKI